VKRGVYEGGRGRGVKRLLSAPGEVTKSYITLVQNHEQRYLGVLSCVEQVHTGLPLAQLATLT
jgi:hypothetical protein